MSEVIWVEEKQELLDLLETEKTVVVDFTAPAWCRPCQQFAPHFDSAAEKSDATFVAVDVDKADWAMVDYGVRGVPTVKLFRNGSFDKDIAGRTVLKVLSEIND